MHAIRKYWLFHRSMKNRINGFNGFDKTATFYQEESNFLTTLKRLYKNIILTLYQESPENLLSKRKKLSGGA